MFNRPVRLLYIRKPINIILTKYSKKIPHSFIIHCQKETWRPWNNCNCSCFNNMDFRYKIHVHFNHFKYHEYYFKSSCIHDIFLSKLCAHYDWLCYHLHHSWLFINIFTTSWMITVTFSFWLTHFSCQVCGTSVT